MHQFVAHVTSAGPEFGANVVIWLSESELFEGTRYFYAHVDQRREVLATALTAMATGFRVRATVDTVESGGGLAQFFLAAE
jgi:hypothetical protein